MRFLSVLFLVFLSLLDASTQAANATYRNAVLADNPLTYWQLDETAGSTSAADAAGTPQNGTYENVTLGQASAFPNLGTCGSFNGLSSRVVTPFDASFNLGSGNFSVEVWYRTSATTRGDIYNFKSSGDFGIFANSGGSGLIGGWHNGNLPSYATTLSAWHHVVYTRSGTTITLYVDGISRSTGTDAQAMSSSASIILGSNTGAFYFNGLIDEVAYYNTALGADRVLAHFNAAQQAATPPTVTNQAASNVYATSATVGATVTDTGGEAPTVTIFYGTADGGTNPAAWTNNLGLGAQSGAATTTVSSLSQATSYFFRARAVNSAGTAWAPTSASFTTGTATAPAVQNLPATHVTGTSANLRGEVTATGNQPPTIKIYYGTTDGGTTAAAWSSNITLAAAQSGAFIQNVANLSPLTTVHYRCMAQNPAGSVWAPSSSSFTTPAATTAGVVINELHIAEDDATAHSEFIELYNAGPSTRDLSGWHFDAGLDYTFPAGTTLAAGAYLIICEDPATIQTKFNVSGAGVFSWQAPGIPRYNSLSNNGEDIVLRDAGGALVDSVDYGLGFPWPTVGDAPARSMELIHHSLDNDVGGHWRSSTANPTPRAVNTVLAANAPPVIRQVTHAATAPVAGQVYLRSGQTTRITAKITDLDGIQSVSLQYQIVEPGDYIKDNDSRYNAAGSWTTLAMADNGLNGDLVAGDDIYSGLIPSSVQTHRRLIRYRITAADLFSASIRVPYADDPQPNFAYFVYDGTPAWTGSKQPGTAPEVTYPSALLESVQQYHLITRVEEHSSAQYAPIPKTDGSSELPTAGAYTHSLYNWKGALCFDGVVYDHIRFRARGGVWRFAMGKNMWKFDFNKGHDFAAKDNYGREYDQKWKKMNFSSVIQQGNFNSRGEQGLYESVGFRLFQLTGMPAEHTQFIHFRIIERPSETNGTASQFDDDFQGLYLGIEQQDGQFLDEHGLPDGNLYKMESGTGELNNQGPSQPSNKSDLTTFLAYGTTEQWWRDNCDLPNYYNYRAIIDCIHHYDIGDGKNYFYYHNPDTNRWTALPWDLDLTWTDNAYRADTGIAGLTPSGNTTEPFFSRIFGNGTTTGIPTLRTEHRNRVREILDLLFTTEQTTMLLDEFASFIYQPGAASFVDADRAMWDYNPILTSAYVDATKAGHGRFYQSAIDNPATASVNEAGTFAGMLQKMRSYVTSRRSVITSQILTAAEEALVPATPVVTISSGASATVATNALTFTSTGFAGQNGATFTAMKWRIAEVTEPGAAGYQAFNHTNRRLYEADPANTVESLELPTFNSTYTFAPAAAKVGHTYRVRVKHCDNTGRWSHWSAPVSFTASAPDINVYLQGLVVSQVMYRPASPSPSEQVIAPNTDSFEWIELKNVGPGLLDLSPVRFTKGIDFDFAGSAVTSLAPGARVVVVSNLAAFNARYSGQLAGVQIAGEWESGDNLSNSGEQIKLSYGAGTTIRDFTYTIAAPWPVLPGAGYGLVLTHPASLPNHNVGANWRSTVAVHGKPGIGDGNSFAAWAATRGVSDPNGDDDIDGLKNIAEYLLTGTPTVPSPAVLPQSSVQAVLGVNYLTFTFRRSLNADDIAWTPQISTTLGSWSSNPGDIIFVSDTNNGDGTATVTYRSAMPLYSGPGQFMRLQMTQR